MALGFSQNRGLVLGEGSQGSLLSDHRVTTLSNTVLAQLLTPLVMLFLEELVASLLIC